MGRWRCIGPSIFATRGARVVPEDRESKWEDSGIVEHASPGHYTGPAHGRPLCVLRARR
jgi:hypothetical protein